MHRLEMCDKVERLRDHFVQLRAELEDMRIHARGPFGIDYLDSWIEKYGMACEACNRLLNADSCVECLMVKLRCLELEYYAYDLYNNDSE